MTRNTVSSDATRLRFSYQLPQVGWLSSVMRFPVELGNKLNPDASSTLTHPMKVDASNLQHVIPAQAGIQSARGRACRACWSDVGVSQVVLR